MYLYRAMGIQEFEKFIHGETIKGQGTNEHKWVCFMPAETEAIPTTWNKDETQNTPKPEPVKVDGEMTIYSLVGIVNPQLYVKFNIDDDKLQEILESEKGRMQFCQYTDDGLTGSHTPDNLALIKELQLSEYSSDDMSIEEVFLFNRYNDYEKASLKGMSNEDICKICKAQMSSPILYYDKEAQFLICADDLDTQSKPILSNYPDVIIAYEHAHRIVMGTKTFYDRTQLVEDEYATDFRRLAFQKFDKMLTSERGFLDMIPDDKDGYETMYEVIQKMYEYRGMPVPQKLTKFYQETAPKARDSIRSEYLSSLTALELENNIYIPVDFPSHNLFKDISTDRIIPGNELIEKLSSNPEAKVIAIEEGQVVRSTAKELVHKMDIKIKDEDIIKEPNEVLKEKEEFEIE